MLFCREIILGEHVLHKNPDCPGQNQNGNTACTYNITRNVSKIIVHEEYRIQYGSWEKNPSLQSTNIYNDIALIRLNEPVELYQDDYHYNDLGNKIKYGAKPVCLPWPSTEEEVLREIEGLNNGQKVVVTGWGRTSNKYWAQTNRIINNKVAVKHLLYLNTTTANDLCEQTVPTKLDTDIQICAGGDEGKF